MGSNPVVFIFTGMGLAGTEMVMVMVMATVTAMEANMAEDITWIKKEGFFQPLKNCFAGKKNGNYQ